MCTTITLDTKIEEFMKNFREHGIGCGIEISKVAKEIHPNAIAIIPLYRSCIVIEQNDDNRTEGTAIIHAYGDPHWLGRDITIENLKSDDFHQTYVVNGYREGPRIIPIDSKIFNDNKNDESSEVLSS